MQNTRNTPLEIFGAVMSGISLTLHLLDFANGFKAAYAAARNVNDEAYWQMECDGVEAILKEIRSFDENRDAWVSASSTEEQDVALKRALTTLKSNKDFIDSVCKNIRSELSANRNSIQRLSRGVMSVVYSLVWIESDVEKAKRLFLETRAVLGIFETAINGRQLSILNSGVRQLLSKIGERDQDAPLSAVLDALNHTEELIAERYANSAQMVSVFSSSQIHTAMKWQKDIVATKAENLLVDNNYFEYGQRSRDLGANWDTRDRVPDIFSCEDYRRQGFIEWRPWTLDEEGSKTNVSRQVMSIVSVLGSNPPNQLPDKFPQSARLPHCHGYFLDNKNSRYGIFLSYHDHHQHARPGDRLSMPPEPKSLYDVLLTKNVSLNAIQKIEAIKNILCSVYMMHSIQVHHKAFTSRNIIFLDGTDANSLSEMASNGSRIAGFSQARFSDWFSDHAHVSEEAEIYMPWKYLEARRGVEGPTEQKFFHAKYNLFGAGLVAVELALSKTAKEILSEFMTWGGGGSRREMKINWKTIKESVVNQCGTALGAQLATVVEWCLVQGAAGGVFGNHTSHLEDLNSQITALESFLRRHKIG